MTYSNALTHTGCKPRTNTSLLARLRSMLSLSRSRTALSALSKAQLQDIGVTAKQAREEARRPAWDVPANWRK